ncbi:MAG TPA: tetratricopeptide repeat protein [candidate division Zixibacteria bacterium]|nr:tetratricopeptide repeat protein [candidate division Zixibacteria bacterium]
MFATISSIARRRALLRDAVILCLACGVVVGCATTQSRQAAQFMDQGRHARAIPLLTALVLENPTDAKTYARLGEAQYHTDDIDGARTSFQKAIALDAGLSASYLYLGYIAEQTDSIDLALAHYQSYLDHKSGGETYREVAQRVELLRRARAEAFAKQAMARERELRPSSYSDSTVGVVYFNGDHLSESLRPLVRGLSDMLITDLSIVPGLRVVERLKTDKLLDELQLGRTSAFDTASAPRLGKLLGAAHVLGGDATELSHGRLRFDPQIVRTTTGDVALTDEQVGELASFFRMEKQIVFDVIAELGFKLTNAVRDSIARVPTESFVAFLAYSRGLELQDAGQFRAAQQEFEKARAIDPDFRAAGARARESANLSALDPRDAPVKVEAFAKKTADNRGWREKPVATDRRLGRLLENGGLMRPVRDRNVDDPYTPPSGRTTVIINGRFDDAP